MGDKPHATESQRCNMKTAIEVVQSVQQMIDFRIIQTEQQAHDCIAFEAGFEPTTIKYAEGKLADKLKNLPLFNARHG